MGKDGAWFWSLYQNQVIFKKGTDLLQFNLCLGSEPDPVRLDCFSCAESSASQCGTSHGSAWVAYTEKIIAQYSGADFLSPV